ncbi:MAG TPA: oxaloacetate decarboxylase [Chloroflexota bacterium]|nr:oxaloacetate decarboxylase [Chloroflexota bacterium]
MAAGAGGVPRPLRAGAPCEARARLRALLARPTATLLPGAADALTARLVEEAGFEACYVTGSGIANAQFGIADVGLVSLAEVAQQAARIAAATRLPVVVDADTGYGNPLNVMRTVAELERAGVAAIQLEDQVTPKRCGHFTGKEVIPTEEMIAKLEAAREARGDSGLVLIARTDAAAVLGFDAAVERARAYVAAGADVLFVEAPRTVDELRRIPRELPGVPHIVNVVVGGLTPVLPRAELEALGFRLILYAGLALQAAALAVRDALRHLAEHGDPSGMQDRILSFAARQALVDLPAVEALERRFGAQH